MNPKEHILLIATYALVGVVGAFILMFIYAIIDPAVDDTKVFDIIGPGFPNCDWWIHRAYYWHQNRKRRR